MAGGERLSRLRSRSASAGERGAVAERSVLLRGGSSAAGGTQMHFRAWWYASSLTGSRRPCESSSAQLSHGPRFQRQGPIPFQGWWQRLG